MTLDGPDPPAFAWLSRTALLLVVSVAGCGRDNSGFEANQPEAQPSTTLRGGAEIETARMADMLERIARRELGDARRADDIFKMNRDQLTSPDDIQPGMVLRLPE